VTKVPNFVNPTIPEDAARDINPLAIKIQGEGEEPIRAAESYFIQLYTIKLGWTLGEWEIYQL